MKTIEELDEDATQEELDGLEEDFSEEEKKQSDAFDDYLAETCEDEVEDPAEVPTEEAPTEEPSE